MTDADDHPGLVLADQLAQFRRDERDRLTQYHAIRARGHSRFQNQLRIEYRCSARPGTDHLLMQVWVDHGNPHWYTPPYRIPPARENEESTEAGRQRHRKNGKWPERTYPLTAETSAVKLQCSHFNGDVLTSELLALLDVAQPGKPIRRRV